MLKTTSGLRSGQFWMDTALMIIITRTVRLMIMFLFFWCSLVSHRTPSIEWWCFHKSCSMDCQWLHLTVSLQHSFLVPGCSSNAIISPNDEKVIELLSWKRTVQLPSPVVTNCVTNEMNEDSFQLKATFSRVHSSRKSTVDHSHQDSQSCGKISTRSAAYNIF